MSQGLSSNLQKQSGKYPKITWVVFMCSSKRTLEYPLPETKERTWTSLLLLSILKYWFFFSRKTCVTHDWMWSKGLFPWVAKQSRSISVLFWIMQPSILLLTQRTSKHLLPTVHCLGYLRTNASEHRIHLSCGNCHLHYQPYAFSYHFYLWYTFICKLDTGRE